jgi:putative addiction module component (TIGR02574 family)
MSVAAEKVAAVLALPVKDRAFLVHELIASLDNIVEMDAETQWQDVIERRSREIQDGQVPCRPVAETMRDIRAKLPASPKPS